MQILGTILLCLIFLGFIAHSLIDLYREIDNK
jgi:hypothetical protein